MIDGGGYGWTNVRNTGAGIVGVPNPTGGTFSTGNEGDGFARISSMNLPDPVITFALGTSEEAVCTNVVVVSDTKLTCETSAHSAGAVDVTVASTLRPTNNGTLSGGYEYLAAPVIISITQDWGPLDGQQIVTIIGENFGSGTKILVGGMACTSVTRDIIMPTEKLTCVTGASNAPRLVDVVVDNAGQTATLMDGYLYRDPIIVTSVNPDEGLTTGGETVTITGSGFFGGADALAMDPEDYNYTGGVQTFTAPSDGWYFLEAWGASGAQYGTTKQSGRGGYSAGEIYLTAGTELSIFVGGSPVNNAAGYNGGGVGEATYGGGGGGGATDFRFFDSATPATAWNDAAGLRYRIMVAGGGGGNDNYNNGNPAAAGGYGGGLVAGSASEARMSGVAAIVLATGGTQTAGGTRGTGGQATATDGGFGIAGVNAATYATAGAGGGYWGGGGGSHNSSVLVSGPGGSSYISGHTGSVAIIDETGNVPKTGCVTGDVDPACSHHFTNMIFENTIMVDGEGYNWTNARAATADGMPDPAGGMLATGNVGNGVARITGLGLLAPTVTFVAADGTELACTSVNVISDTTLTCVTSPHHDQYGGLVDVIVASAERPTEIYGELTDGYNYIPPWYITLTLDKLGAYIAAVPNTSNIASVDHVVATTDTNWPGGYELFVSQETGDTNLTCTVDSTLAVPVTSTNGAVLDVNSWGVGVGDATDAPNLWHTVSGTPSLLATRTADGVFDDYVYFGANVDFSQKACADYVGVVTLSVVAGF